MKLQALLLFVHLAGVVVWVGGMFFAYFCLRPAALAVLEPPQRLKLWSRVFARFFAWLSPLVVAIGASGLLMFRQHGFAGAPLGWHLMLASGSLMIAIYVYVAMLPFRALKQAVAAEDWPRGGAALNRIRQMVATNLVLALLTIGFATVGLALPR